MYVKKAVAPIFRNLKFFARMQNAGPVGPEPTTGRGQYDPNIMVDRAAERSIDYLDEEIKLRHAPFMENPEKEKHKGEENEKKWTGECPW
uniref:Uncharacterized protein n=1 Tax=Acrobeloides nanus TaxID=290746 RepID=A0A914CBU4_9BILA